MLGPAIPMKRRMEVRCGCGCGWARSGGEEAWLGKVPRFSAFWPTVRLLDEVIRDLVPRVAQSVLDGDASLWAGERGSDVGRGTDVEGVVDELMGDLTRWASSDSSARNAWPRLLSSSPGPVWRAAEERVSESSLASPEDTVDRPSVSPIPESEDEELPHEEAQTMVSGEPAQPRKAQSSGEALDQVGGVLDELIASVVQADQFSNCPQPDQLG